MVKKQHIKVIKIPLIREENHTRVSNFPKTHTLYLELLENKNKIKQDFINKTYIPSHLSLSKNISDQTQIKQHKDDEVHKQKDQQEDENKEEEQEEQDQKEDDENIKELDKKVYEDKYEDKYEEVKEEPSKERDDENQDEEKRKRREEKRKRREERHKRREERHKQSREETDHEKRNDTNYEKLDRDHKRRDERDDDSKREERDNEREDDMQDRKSEKHKNRSRNTNDSDNLSERLKLLLADNESIKSVSSQSKSIQKHKSRHEERSIRSFKHSSHDRREVPPTLDELEAGGLYQKNTELRDINNIHQTDYEEEDGKRELIFKFDLLKKSYKDATNIPEFSIHSDYNTMKKTYESTVRRLSLDSTVESYKTYLIGGFMLVEFILGNFLKFDMQGFTQQQIISINTYERLLIELGEKSYVPEGSKWPVELRLVFMIIMNAAFFIISKMIMKKTGSNLMNMINSMNVSSRPASIAKKRPMKGPSIDPNDIPDLNSV